MALDRRKRDAEWFISDKFGAVWTNETYGRQHSALLMDIRDELKKANATNAHNLQRIDRILRTISKKVPRRKAGGS